MDDNLRLPPFRAKDGPPAATAIRYPPTCNPYPPSLLQTTSYGSSSSYASSASYRPPLPPPVQHHSPYPMVMESSTPEDSAPLTGDSSFDVLDWHPAYQSCQRYFLDYAQHEPGTQALCALINIKLPHQWLSMPVFSAVPAASGSSSSQSTAGQFTFGNYPRGGSSSNGSGNGVSSPSRGRNGQREATTFVSLVPYIRRLVVTGFDKPPILHGFFGDDYVRGVLPHVECERRNYLFAAKHGGWRTCKKQYDGGSGGGGVDETVPFMKPLQDSKAEEMNAADKAWSSWLAMEDWMVGPRAPEGGRRASREREDSGNEGYHRR